jgi:signal peptidase I
MVLKENIKKYWNWMWNSDSTWSWIVALVFIFIIVKFIFFPLLSLIFGTSLPIVGIESSSMDHQIVSDDYGRLNLCGKLYSSEEKQHITFDKYWDLCGSWYEQKNISKNLFSKFSLNNGFSKGDIIFVWGRFTPKIGDVIIFKANQESTAPRPIIHRIIAINNEIMQTKGDHNQEQLTSQNNIYHTDETSIKKDQIIGKAIFKIPYLGWPKIWISEILNAFS